MTDRIVEIDATDWQAVPTRREWVDALEAGKVLYFPRLGFRLSEQEQGFLRPDIREPKTRNISLNVDGSIKGAVGDAGTQQALAAMVARFRTCADALVAGLLPSYGGALRSAPTSYRPMRVETRAQSWRADDKRLHVDAFPSRPTHGERILRVFTNVNPDGAPRVWRVGESFEAVAERFLPRAKPYSAWQAKVLNALHVTKSLRGEYDHLMLQLHDGMKADMAYQKSCDQMTMPFPPGTSWVCFSDQATHAVMSGQYMMEQTYHLKAGHEVDPASSPLQILARMKGRPLAEPA